MATWVDTTQPSGWAEGTYGLLVVYAAASTILLLATWNNWWLESRIAAAAHIADLLVFTALVFLTEGYTSPFFVFFVFLVLSAAIRWGWREALFTTFVVVMLFFAVSAIASAGNGPNFEMQRFVIRGANLVVISLMIVWFGVNQRVFGPRWRESTTPDFGRSPLPPVREAMQHAATTLGAGRVVFAWSDVEEPWLNIALLEEGAFRTERAGPATFRGLVREELAARPFLFDRRKGRILLLQNGHRHGFHRKAFIHAGFANRFDIDVGIAIPVRSDDHEGHLFALAITGLCSDDLRIAARLERELAAIFERTAFYAATRDAAAARARLLIARDLHDSVVQFLAGLGLKLQAIRRSAVGVPAMEWEIDELQQQLVQEQKELRRLIEALRDPARPSRAVDLAEHLPALVARLERRWEIPCQLRIGPAPIPSVPPDLLHNVEQLVHEGVSNAVRHGDAHSVTLRVSRCDGELGIDLYDDGRGFPVTGEFGDAELAEQPVRPRSLYDRVHMMGGTLRLKSSAKGATLSIRLPLEGDAA